MFGFCKKTYCNVCGSKRGVIDNDPTRPRESFRCRSCRSNSRQRTMALFLGGALGFTGPACSWPKDKAVHIFESSGFGGYPPYLTEKYTYYNTDFDPEVIARGGYDTTRYADLQQMPYADGTFDALLSSDVLEHVRDYKRALGEIYRVLKDGGVMLLQVPYNHARLETMFRIKVEGDKDVQLMEPYYHAKVHLVYRDYGRDLLGWVREAGFTVAYAPFALTRHSIPRQEMIIAAKSDYIEMGGYIEALKG